MSALVATTRSSLICVVWFILLVNDVITSNGQRNGSRGDSFLSDILSGYDSRVPPSFAEGNSTVVECEVYVSSVDSISESTMDFSMTIFLRQTWRDRRLAFGHVTNVTSVTMDARLLQSIWVPDLFFPHEKKAHFHDVTIPNRLLRISRDGSVFYSARMSLTLSCAMRLYKFPLDNQVCSMHIESYAYTMKDLQLKWSQTKALQLSDDMELPQFTLQRTDTSYCVKSYTTGDFPCLEARFYLRRDIGYYMIQTYIPSALIVILSWVSFWINLDAVPARISLGVLTILTMTTQSSGSRSSLPRVSYVKAIDVWMSTCLVFVFAALLEFAIVNVLSRKEIRRSMANKNAADRLFQEKDIGAGVKPEEMLYVRDPRGKQKARQVDTVSRTAFPVAFVTFNLVYWIMYLLWVDSGT